MQHNQETGRKGEDLAVEFLQKKEYAITHRNWRFGKDEVDIIAMDGNTVVIVEVKTRYYDYTGGIEKAVTYQKQKFLIRAADAYIRNNNIDNETRFDIVTVLMYKGKVTIEHIENAFGAGW